MRAQRMQIAVPICCWVGVMRIVVFVGWPRACTGCAIQSIKRGSDVGQRRMANCDKGIDDRFWFRVG